MSPRDGVQRGLEEFLERRMKKAAAAILGTKEREIDPYITDEASEKFRKVVLDQLNAYHDLVLDALDKVDPGAVINEVALDLLEEIRGEVNGG